MLASERSENHQTELRSIQHVHQGISVGVGIRMAAGFYYNIRTSSGKREGAKKRSGENIGVHQPIRITNCNLSFIFLVGKNGKVMTTIEQILLKCQAQR